MRDGERRGFLDDVCDGIEKHLHPAGTRHAHMVECGKAIAKFRRVFQYDAVLAALREDGGNEPLAKRVIQCGINRGGSPPPGQNCWTPVPAGRTVCACHLVLPGAWNRA